MNSVLKGSIFVALGASCYGLLTTFVKLAYAEDFTTYEVTFSQLIIGFVALCILNLFLKKKHRPIQDSKLRNKTIDFVRNFTWIYKYFLLFSDAIYYCFRWHCAVDAKRLDGRGFRWNCQQNKTD